MGKDEPIDLKYLVGGNLHVIITMLTRTSNGLEAIKRLCDMGYVEHALLLVNRLLGDTVGRSSVVFIPYKLPEIPVACTVVEPEKTSTGSAYIIIETMIQGVKSIYCYAIDFIEDKPFMRACSHDEIGKLITETRDVRRRQKNIGRVRELARSIIDLDTLEKTEEENMEIDVKDLIDTVEGEKQ